MTDKYRASAVSNTINRHRVAKETPKTVTSAMFGWGGRRERKDGAEYAWRDTYAEAKAALIAMHTRKLEELERKAESIRALIAGAEKMEETDD